MATTTANNKSSSTAKPSSALASLNVYKKVSIIRKSDDTLTYEDEDGTRKTISDLGDAFSSAAPSLQQRPKHDIPTPQILTVDSYKKDVPASYHTPISYVRYQRPPPTEVDTDLEYVVDAEDEVWLINNAKFGQATKRNAQNNHQRKRPQLPLSLFERMLDCMEKATGFEAIITSDQAERLCLSKIPELLHLFPFKASGGHVTVKHVMNDVYSYWLHKRSKLKRPLLRRFWPVTATDDTNPHLVFRPREKEKYKLRKKRQNDMDAFRKMKQLKSDFNHVQALLKLVKRREELNRCTIQLQADWFEQRLYDVVDTSGQARNSSRLRKSQIEQLLDVPQYFDETASGPGSKRGRKRRRSGGDTSMRASPVIMDMQAAGDDKAAAGPHPAIVAGRNHGEPAPLYVHPLQTRETYTTSYDKAVPFIPSYVNTHATPTFRFRHRPRLGRGGRLCIDRVPHPGHPNVTPVTVFTAGSGLAHATGPKKQLFDLLPEPIDHNNASRRIEEICIAALKDDMEVAMAASSAGVTAPGAVPPEAEENDCEAVLVKMEDWLDTDDQLWGEERFAIGPL